MTGVFRERSLLGPCIALTGLFLVVFASRPVMLNTTAAIDDYLFAFQGFQIASASWLGAYDSRTLVKGPGYPLFLAFGHFTGLPYPLFLGLFLTACSAYFSYVTWRIWKQPWLSCAIYFALLLTPGLFHPIHITRDTFYAGLSLATIAGALHLFLSASSRPTAVAVLLGFLMGVFWLTREEGVWIVPALTLIALAGFIRSCRKTSSAESRRRALRPFALCLTVFATILCAVATLNLEAYGQFTLNEIKGGPFQAAMVALQRAALPYRRAYIPVPREARERIYEASPTFRQLEPLLEKRGWAYAATCQRIPEVCGDIAGGWFIWYFRSAAETAGAHRSASTAARFYRQIAAEVNEACQDGRLTCASIMPPLIPPMTARQVPTILMGTGRALRHVVGDENISLRSDLSKLRPERQALMLHLLNNPPVAGVALNQSVSIEGAIAPPAQAIVTAIPNAGARISSVEGLNTPASAEVDRNHFRLLVECVAEPCRVDLQSEGKAVATFDLDAPDLRLVLRPAARAFHVTLSRMDRLAYRTMRDRLVLVFRQTLPVIAKVFLILNSFGAAAFLGLLALCALRRELSAFLVASAAMASAALARALLIALVDATSFPAVTSSYLLPAVLLAPGFSIISIAGFVVELRALRNDVLKRDSADTHAEIGAGAMSDLALPVQCACRDHQCP